VVRGRPVGSRNAVSRPHQVMVRLTEDELGWVVSKTTPELTQSDVLRWLIDMERKRERRRQ
jgi:hypothetical protein